MVAVKLRCQKYEVTLNITVKGTRNWLFNPGVSIDENLTAPLQRYLVLGDERKQNNLNFKTANNSQKT
jgi:hypothetical protein